MCADQSGFAHSMIAAGPSQLAVGGVLGLGNFVTRLLLSLSEFVLRDFVVA